VEENINEIQIEGMWQTPEPVTGSWLKTKVHRFGLNRGQERISNGDHLRASSVRRNAIRRNQ
jgi:hypothetical protein